MIKVKNLEIYIDDNEIIDVLKDLPKMEDFDNLNILSFIQNRTVDADFGTVIGIKNRLYTVYKFDKKHFGPKDAGLLLTVSDEKYAAEHIEYWSINKNSGMKFSDKIFDTLMVMLSDISIISKFC
jgi:hypothetical protein